MQSKKKNGIIQNAQLKQQKAKNSVRQKQEQRTKAANRK